MQLSVSAATLAKLAGTLQTRRLILRNTGENIAYFGFESTVTAASGATQGVPLKADEVLVLDQAGEAFQDTLHFVCAEGESTTINYTRREA